jgi:polysaccharide biosynthesis/export protein
MRNTFMSSSVVCSLVSGVLLASALIAAEAVEAQAPAAPDRTARDGGRGITPEAYRIGPEDMLQIFVWKNDAMSRTVPVRPDGKISLPLLNDVQAAGLTALELREILAKKIAEYIPSPEVSVIVADVRSFKVSVIGEVTRPGRYELKSWATVLDALALAGGFTQFAARSRIVILHPDGTTMKRIPFNYNKLTGEQENFYLRNGDIVLVP